MVVLSHQVLGRIVRRTPFAALGLLALASGAVAGPVRTAVPPDAPDWTAVTLDGDTLSMRGMRGEIVVLDFWGTWCPPCIAWLPRLAELEKRYAPRGVRFVTVNVESVRPRERHVEYVRDFLEKRAFDFTTIPYADSTVVRAHQIVYYPTVMVIDGGGRIRYASSGAVRETETSLVAELEGLLAKQ